MASRYRIWTDTQTTDLKLYWRDIFRTEDLIFEVDLRRVFDTGGLNAVFALESEGAGAGAARVDYNSTFSASSTKSPFDIVRRGWEATSSQALSGGGARREETLIFYQGHEGVYGVLCDDALDLWKPPWIYLQKDTLLQSLALLHGWRQDGAEPGVVIRMHSLDDVRAPAWLLLPLAVNFFHSFPNPSATTGGLLHTFLSHPLFAQERLDALTNLLRSETDVGGDFNGPTGIIKRLDAAKSAPPMTGADAVEWFRKLTGLPLTVSSKESLLVALETPGVGEGVALEVAADANEQTLASALAFLKDSQTYWRTLGCRTSLSLCPEQMCLYLAERVRPHGLGEGVLSWAVVLVRACLVHLQGQEVGRANGGSDDGFSLWAAGRGKFNMLGRDLPPPIFALYAVLHRPFFDGRVDSLQRKVADLLGRLVSSTGRPLKNRPDLDETIRKTVNDMTTRILGVFE